jgi:hypothetical protein
MHGLDKLLQEAFIATEEPANIVDAVPEHGDTLRPHAKGEAAVDGWIISAIAEHIGVHHACARYFEPAAVLADAAATPFTQKAFDVELYARLRKGEVAGTEAGFGAGAVESLGKADERALEI